MIWLPRTFLFLFFFVAQPTWAQDLVEVWPKSETARAVYLQSRPGKRTLLKLNEKNLVDPALLEGTNASVVYTREGYLDRFVPILPSFLESGFPGDFTNLERHYTLRVATTPQQVAVYEVGRSSDQPSQKSYLGTTGTTPIRIDRLPYFNENSGKFSDVRLLFEHEHYEPKILEMSAKELVPKKELSAVVLSPKPGFASLWNRRSKELFAVGIGVLGLFSLGFVLISRKAKSSGTLVQKPNEKSIGPYRLMESVGRGGTAEVYRARTEDNLDVALKLMHDSNIDQDARERFKREIQTSLKLEHPNFARIYDWGETDDGRLYLVSELLTGQTLSEFLKTEEVGASRNALISTSLLPVAEALEYLHQQDVVHRDVKPGNIFLTADGHTKLIDLGLVRGGELQALTRTGVAVGTPYYMSPEQSAGNYTKQSDQYALGVIAFEILTGSRPFTGKDPMEVFHQHLKAPVPSASDLRPELSLHTSAVVTRMLAKKPEQRFPSVLEAVKALATEFGDQPWSDEDTQAVVK